MKTSTNVVKAGKILGGGLPAGLILIGSRQSAGKTNFSLSLAAAAAGKKSQAAAIFSLDLARESIISKLVAGECGMSYGQMKAISPDSENWAVIAAASARVASAQLYLDDTPDISVEELCSRAVALNKKLLTEGIQLKLVVIDSLELLRIRRRPYSAGHSLVAEIFKRLKGLACEINAPVLVPFQLNRKSSEYLERKRMALDKIPLPEMAKWANMVLLLCREQSFTSGRDANMRLLIARNTNGPIGTVPLSQDYSGRFTGMETIEPQPYF